MSNVAVKDSKAKIFAAFQQILAERQQMASRVATREEEAERAQNQQILERVSQYTADTIVRGLADLQLEFGNTVTGLSSRLTTETTKLEELQRAIAVERDRLQELQKTRVVADALYILTQEHQERLQSLETSAERDREVLEKEITSTRKLWQQEQEEFTTVLTEGNELLTQERLKQEADYQYETEQSRKIAADEYETFRRTLERQLQETGQAKEKDWAEREQMLTANQTRLEEFRQQAAGFPATIEEAVKKAREDGIRELNQEAKVKADLFEKEWEAARQGYELQIQTLEAKIQKQAEQITEISGQLQATLRQAQELAMRAFASANNSSNNAA